MMRMDGWKRWFVGLGLAFGLVLVVAGCTAPPVTATSTPDGDPTVSEDRPEAAIRFMFYRNLPFARASINGKDVGFFLIDTGSSLTVIDKAVAEEHGLPQVGRGRVRGIGGMEDVQYSVLEELVVDRLHVGPHRAATVDLSAFNRSIRWQVAGILGINTLQQHVFTIDYARSMLVVHDGPFVPSMEATPMELYEISRLPAVRARLGKPGATDDVFLQIDTGSNAFLTLPFSYMSKRTDLLAGKQNLQRQSVGVGGAAKNIQTVLDHLVVLGQQYENAPLGVEVNSPNGTYRGKPVGRLGNRLLKRYRLTIDWQGRTAWAELVEPE